MLKLLNLLLVVCIVIGTTDAGVKIDISRVKEPERTTSLPTESTATITVASTASTSNQNDAITESTTLSSANATITVATTLPTTTFTVTPTVPNVTPINETTLTSANDTLLSFPVEFVRREIRRKLMPPNYFCPCDLKINFCDLNCCCDIDCSSPEILQTLKCEDHIWWAYHEYDETPVLRPCSTSGRFSLFCIVDREKQRRIFKKRDFKLRDVDVMQVVDYKWPNRFVQSPSNEDDYRDYYKFGDWILVWDETIAEIQKFLIPRAVTGINCHVKAPIKHLKGFVSKCIQTLDKHEEFISEFKETLKNIRILKQRKSLNTPSIIMSDFCKPPQNATETSNCIEIDVRHCVGIISQETCQYQSNGTSVEASTDGMIASDLFVQFYHNFTNLLNCTVYLVHHDMPDASKVLQTIHVDYLEVNETYATRDVHKVSGNIGYLQHHPIIAARYVPVNENVTEEEQNHRVLNYFHENATSSNNDHHLKVPTITANDECILTKHSFKTIDFGENVRLRCNVVLMLNDNATSGNAAVDPSQNHTITCRQFQTTILSYLLPYFALDSLNSTVFDKFNVHVSEFGNPKNETNAWTKFKTVNAPDFEQIVAKSNVNGEDFTCTNMMLDIRYEFFYGRMMVGEVPNQALIKAARIEFGTRLDLNFKLDDESLRVPIYIDIMFYDFSRIVGNGSVISTMNSALLAAIIFAHILAILTFINNPNVD